ncbi:D-serine ammonia-lyase [Agrilactobacillus fermenti]|uniref:D-serine ammonia-lyase n=1 Tax=Agrilactobacillus fermenti TaxID=2586909 RepID=UPI001E39BC11|nr:D-serine ammonia-lyase [Agrilactobacillus fermenti]MCD2257006.1 D-serine ammonia-lyase [Agrilactobacillus fermenti]
MTNKTDLIQKYPILRKMAAYQPLFWQNPDFEQTNQAPFFSQADVLDAVFRLIRFQPYIESAFPETYNNQGAIESPLIKLNTLSGQLEQFWHHKIPGRIFLKADHQLPIAGSIKARGGIYAALKLAETIARTYSNMTFEDNYNILGSTDFYELFSHFEIVVGSTGNLGLSIGIIGRKLGFKVTVHLSHDAKAWKKDRLKEYGVHVVEHDSDFSDALASAREKATTQANTYFIDDENSQDLFLGYATAAYHLQTQLKQYQITVDQKHPLFVYLPAGVGGSPAGVTFGLKTLLGANVYPIFVEPTHVPSVTLGMITKKNHDISVYDLGLDGHTAADGLAVARPSNLAEKAVKYMLYGSVTFDDDDLFRYLYLLAASENILLEPSAAAGFTGLAYVLQHLDQPFELSQATHIIWATGGQLVPKAEMSAYIQKGASLLHPHPNNFVKF